MFSFEEYHPVSQHRVSIPNKVYLFNQIEKAPEISLHSVPAKSPIGSILYKNLLKNIEKEQEEQQLKTQKEIQTKVSRFIEGRNQIHDSLKPTLKKKTLNREKYFKISILQKVHKDSSLADNFKYCRYLNHSEKLPDNNVVTNSFHSKNMAKNAESKYSSQVENIQDRPYTATPRSIFSNENLKNEYDKYLTIQGIPNIERPLTTKTYTPSKNFYSSEKATEKVFKRSKREFYKELEKNMEKSNNIKFDLNKYSNEMYNNRKVKATGLIYQKLRKGKPFVAQMMDLKNLKTVEKNADYNLIKQNYQEIYGEII